MGKTNYTYLALVNEEFEMTTEVVEYFNSEQIRVLSYFERFGILKLETDQPIGINNNLEYILNLEEEREYRTLDDKMKGHDEPDIEI